MRPSRRLLDLFCGAGGAAMGYHRAGFTEIVGVDIKPQKRYPFTFVLGDALEYVAAHGREFDAIHASPPCQAYSSMRRSNAHPDLYIPVRDALEALSIPWAIENVIGAPARYGVVLCGSMFRMKVQRHRVFETPFLIMQPDCLHEGRERPYTITGNGSRNGGDYKHSRHAPVDSWPEIMGMPWAQGKEIAQAIPPAYTEFIGKQLISYLESRA